MDTEKVIQQFVIVAGRDTVFLNALLSNGWRICDKPQYVIDSRAVDPPFYLAVYVEKTIKESEEREGEE